MNTGGVMIATTAVDAAAGAATMATAASAAVLIVRAAGAASPDGTADPATEVGAGAHWDAVVPHVVAVSARIRMLGASTGRTAETAWTHEPVSLHGLTPTRAAQWAALATEQLINGHAAVRADGAAEERRDVAARLPRSIVSHPDAEAALARFQAALSRRYGSEAAGPGRSATADSVTGIEAEIEEILLALDQDANEREHREVLTAAAHTIRDDPREAYAYVGDLRSRVDAVNEAVGRRRLAAYWLCALEQPTIAAVELPGPLQGIAMQLRTIVAGDEDLTPECRARATEAVAWAADVARRCFVQDVISQWLSERGYVVDGEPDLPGSGELRLTRAEWRGEHSVEIWLDRHGVVHGRLVRERLSHADGRHAGSGERGLIERSRCDGFSADLEMLGRLLRSDVVTDVGCFGPPGPVGVRHRPPLGTEDHALEA